MAPSISELVNKDLPVYVQNLTREPRSVITCTFHTPGRQPHTVFLPATDFPVKVYPGMLSKHALLDGSEQLQRFIRMGALRLVPAKKAREMLADPEVAKQAELAVAMVNSASASRRYAENIKSMHADTAEAPTDGETYYRGPKSNYPTTNNDNNPIAMAVRQALSDAGVGPKVEASASMSPSRTAHQLDIAGVDPNVDPKVLGLVAGWTAESDLAILTVLRSTSGLKIADYNYIIQCTGRNSASYQWAAEKLVS